MEEDILENTSPTKEDSIMEIGEAISMLTDMEKKYCNIVVTQNPKSKAQALKRAGSQADAKYLSKMAWELEQRPHVQAYIAHLRTAITEQLSLSVEEVVANARKAIEMAFEMGKPKDADPHNRLLAELGGFIKSAGATSQQVAIKVENSLKSEDVDKDFDKIRTIAGLTKI